MFRYWNDKGRHLTVVDIGLTKLSVFGATLIIVKLMPQLLTIDFNILIMMVILFSAKPLYSFFFKS